MWISSSIKNRVSNRGRIDIFSRGSISGWKASLLLLALASFSVVCAASDTCELLEDGTCVAKKSDDLKDGRSDYIDIENGKITWDASKSKPDSKIELYSQPCKDLSFTLPKPTNLVNGEICEFSMLYKKCDMDIEWQKDRRTEEIVRLTLRYGDKTQVALDKAGSEVKVDLDGANLKCEGCSLQTGTFCDFEFSPGDLCSFKFAFKKKTGSCNGEIQFGERYKLGFPAPPTVPPETTPTTDATSIAANDPNNANAIGPNNANTTPGADAAGLSPWIIVAIVVGVLIFVAAGVGLIVFLICRRKRGSAQNMAEKGTVGSNYQCETVVPPTKSTLCADQPYQSESAASSVHSKKDRKAEDERSKPTSQVEVAKTVSQKNAKNVPDPSPSPLPEENKPKRILTPDELYEPLGDPAKAIPMHLSEKKISEKKKGHGMNFANRKFGKKLPQT